jgi:hypothetical protein
MDSPQQHPITDEDARRLARELVRLFQTPLRVMGTKEFDESITTADLVRFGAMLLNGVNAAARDHLLKEKNRLHISTVIELIHQPEELEAYFFSLIRKNGEGVGDINEAIAELEQLMSGRGADLKILKNAIDEAMPKARQGRPTDFDPAADPARFLARSSELTTPLGKFLDIKTVFPKKPAAEIVDFLEPEFPADAGTLRDHSAYISEIVRAPEFRALKASSKKARMLADALTGRELFGWSFIYSTQKAAEFRRMNRARHESK